MSARRGAYAPHSTATPHDCPHCHATAGFTRRELDRIHAYAIAHGGGPFTMPPTVSPRRFDVLGGPGGYLSARYVGALRPDEYVATWQRLVRVNVPRRFTRPYRPDTARAVGPRAVYGDVLAHFEVAP